MGSGFHVLLLELMCMCMFCLHNTRQLAVSCVNAPNATGASCAPHLRLSTNHLRRALRVDIQ